MAGPSQWRMNYHRMWGQLSTTCSNVLKQPNGELLVAVDHNQLRTMASKAVDPIDWLHLPPSWAVPRELHVLHGVNEADKPQDMLQQPELERVSTGMPEKRSACGHSVYTHIYFT